MSTPEQQADLVDQLRYLIDEAEAMEPLLAGLPADVPTMHLPGERSILGTLAHLAALDRVALDRLRQMLTEDRPAFEETPMQGTEHGDIETALADLRAARSALSDAFSAVPTAGWSRAATFPDGSRRDVAGFALAITQRDTAELRRLAYRLHESNLRDV